MSAFSAWAGELREAANRMNSSLALDACEAIAEDYLATLRIVTPKRTGKLAGSEAISGIGGGGAHATAEVGPHIIYASFRENGGTIVAKGGLGRKGKRPHTLHFEGVFALRVTQAGAHYMEKSIRAFGNSGDGVAAEVLGKLFGD